MNKNSIIIGDINLPGIKWKDGISDSKGRKLYNTAYENNIEQLIEVATHEKGGILDLVLTKNPNQILSIDVLDNLAKSDHNMILIEIFCSAKVNNSKEKIYDWKKADIEKIRDGIAMCYLPQPFCIYNSFPPEWVDFS